MKIEKWNTFHNYGIVVIELNQKKAYYYLDWRNNMSSFGSDYSHNNLKLNQSQLSGGMKPYNLVAGPGEVTSQAPANGGRALSLYKQKFICLYSHGLRKFMYIDLIKARYDRMRKSVLEWADLMKMVFEYGHRMVMLTLTYRNMNDWKANDIDRFVKKLRKTLGDNLKTYIWVAELQKRGAIHYHMLIIVKSGTNVPKLDDYGLWPHGITRRETARTPYYMVTYLGKEYQKNFSEFPRGARCFGVGVFGAELRYQYRLSRMKKWEQDFLVFQGDLDDLKIARALRKECLGWEMVYQTDDFETVKSIYEGFVKNGMISEEEKWRSCQDGFHELKIDDT